VDERYMWSSSCGCSKPALYWNQDFNARICNNCGTVITEGPVKDNAHAVPFVHLRVHTHLSFLRAICKTEDIINKAKSLKMPAIAKTEFGNMCGVPSFVKECIEAGIKPILGTEFQVKFGVGAYPVTVLALNKEGYKSLVKLNTTAWIERKQKENEQPFLLVSDLNKRGILALVEFSNVPTIKTILQQTAQQTETWIEATNHSITKIEDIISLQTELKLPVVATNNVLYTEMEDHEPYKTALKIGKHQLLVRDEPDYYLKSTSEMLAHNFPIEWYENTVKIADRVENYGLINKNLIIPTFKDACGEWTLDQAHGKLTMSAWDGLSTKGLSDNKEYADRLIYELETIKNKKFSSYFLIIAEIIAFMKKSNLLKPIGRGCLTGDALVLTSSRGYIPLQDVEVGDKVITHTGEIKDVLNTYCYDVDEELLEINSEYSHNNIKLTKDHKVYAYRRKHNSYRRNDIPLLSQELKSAQPDWVKTEDLRAGDYIYTPFLTSRKTITQPFKYDLSKYIPGGKESIFSVNNNTIECFIYKDTILSEREISKNTGVSRSYLRRHRKYNINDNARVLKINRYINIDKDFAYFIGRWIGDGWITSVDVGKKNVGIAFHKEDIAGQNKILRFLRGIGFDVKIYNHPTKKCVQLLIYNILLYNLLNSMFPKYTRVANTKSLSYVKYWPNNLLREVMSGLIESDGHREKCGTSLERENIDTTSHQLMLDIQEALLYLRIPSYVQIRKHKNKKWNTAYKIRFHGINTKIKTPLVTSHGYYSKIKNITTVKANKVYDISVKDNKSYLVKSGIVHNSSVGSLVCYALDITSMDPIKWNVPFERFINFGRIDLPDVDTDITQEGRNTVLRHIADTYGKDRVAQIATYQTMGLRASINNVGAALSVPFVQNRDLRNKIPEETMSADDLPEEIKNELAQIPGWLDTSISLNDLAKNLGYHAAGIVISNEPISEMVPLLPESEGLIGIQYDMKDIEILGMLKLDMLGLKTLDVVQHALQKIKASHNIDLDIYNLPSDDAKTYETITKGDYVSIFQLDSPGYRKLCRQLQPNSFEHIMALNALFRPGPLEGGMTAEYVERRHGKKELVGWHHWLDDVLAPTYQVPVFQEQVIAISKIIAGFDDVEADKYRKAIGKKNKEEFDLAQQKFKEGAMKKEGLVPPSDFKGSLEAWLDDMLKRLAGYARYGWNCLAINTPISTCNRGLIPIQKIKPGEELWSVRENSGEIFRNKVIKVINNGIRDVIKITTQGGRSVICTNNHRFLTPEHTYKYASDLFVGDFLKVFDERIPSTDFSLRMTSSTQQDEIPIGAVSNDFIGDNVVELEVRNRTTKNTVFISINKFLSIFRICGSVISGFLGDSFTPKKFKYTFGIDNNVRISEFIGNSLLTFNSRIKNINNKLLNFWCYFVDCITFKPPFSEMSRKRSFGCFKWKFFDDVFAAISSSMQFLYCVFISKINILLSSALNTIVNFFRPFTHNYLGTTLCTDVGFGVCSGDTIGTISSNNIVGSSKNSITRSTENFNCFHNKIINGWNVSEIDKIVDIKYYGTTEVWDLVMEQNPNFSAGGIWVHNSGHAAGYGYLTYITAYLEAHYPLEYYVSLLDLNKLPDKITALIRGILYKGFKIVPPHVNESSIGYDIGSDGRVYMGLSAIRSVGKAADAIIEERTKNGKFESFIQFCQRMPSINKGIKTNLVKSGAFSWDKIINDRHKIDNIDVIHKIVKRKNGITIPVYQIAMECYVEGEGFTDIQKQQNEREVLNSFITGHPAAVYQRLANSLERDKTSVICPSMLKGCAFEQNILLVGMLENITRKTIQKEGRNKGKPYISLRVSDNEATININVWYPMCEEMSKYLVTGQIGMFDCVTKSDKFRPDLVSLNIHKAVMLTYGLPIQGVFCVNGTEPPSIINELGGIVNESYVIGDRKFASIRGRIAVMPDVLESIVNKYHDNVKFLVSMDPLEHHD